MVGFLIFACALTTYSRFSELCMLEGRVLYEGATVRAQIPPSSSSCFRASLKAVIADIRDPLDMRPAPSEDKIHSKVIN